MIYVLKSNIGKPLPSTPLKRTRRAALKTRAKIPISPKARWTKYITATDEVNLCRKL